MAVLAVLMLSIISCSVLASDEKVSRDDFYFGQFPDGFIWSASTAAYQIEGAWNKDGRGLSFWDNLAHNAPFLKPGGFIPGNATGDVACDSYHKYKDDVRILKNLGVNYYRFSLSWSRILPNGTLAGGVNEKGVQYYNNVINELLKNDIQPMVTIYHFDEPLDLAKLGGWTNRNMVGWFNDYARLCFERFGDRVKFWITINEPSVVVTHYSFPKDQRYLASHHIILGHARAWRSYDKDFRSKQKGKVGITLDSQWFEPRNNNDKDRAAAERALQFHLGLYANPIFVNGDYPEIVKALVAQKSRAGGLNESRLLSFTEDEKTMIKGTHDFFAYNTYSTYLVEYRNYTNSGANGTTPQKIETDQDNVRTKGDAWATTDIPWLTMNPWGMRRLLVWVKQTYNNPTIYITENGCNEKHESERHNLDDLINDYFRVDYLRRYINEMLKAIHVDGVDVRGYSVWTLMDNFEWNEGFHGRFGIHYINRSDPNLTRQPKLSATFYQRLIKDNGFPDYGETSAAARVSVSFCMVLLCPAIFFLM